MRVHFISALSILVSGCATVTAAGTEEAVLFTDPSAEASRAVLKPHDDLPLSIEFACPDKLVSMMTYRMIPFPPVMPMGFVNDHVSYLRVTMPEGAEDAIAQTRVVTPAGIAMPLSAARQAKRNAAGDGNVEVIYALDKDCEALNGGVVEVAGFSYSNKQYPAAEARLQFASKIKHRFDWSANGLAKGGRDGVLDDFMKREP